MYCKSLLCIAVLFILLGSSSYATLDADSVLWVPRAKVAPVIDGEMDPVWYSVTNTLMTKALQGEFEPDDWFDLWGQFKLMYNYNNLYGFIIVHDDSINYDHIDSWEQDGIELFIDGDNSKIEGDYETCKDVQFRINTQWLQASQIVYGFGAIACDGIWDFSGIDFAFKLTDLGYNIEFSIPLSCVMIEPKRNCALGFELQINDSDSSGGRESGWRWWCSSNDTWKDASLFGTAKLGGNDAQETLTILKTNTIPAIDGILDSAWVVCSEYSSHSFVTHTAYIHDDWNIYESVEDWNDMSFDFRVMWDFEYFYLFANVRDDMISTKAGEESEKDGIELYFDGDNSKNDYTNGGVPYDANDKHFRQVFSLVPTNYCACQVTKQGWTMEWRIPYYELGWLPGFYHDIGFDVQLNDQDNPALLRSGAVRWWGNDNNARQDASMFGTATIVYQYGDPDCEFFYGHTFNATDVTNTFARLNGQVSTQETTTFVKFYYGTTYSLGNEIWSVNSPLANTTGTLVYTELSDLTPNTKYYYQLMLFSDGCVRNGDVLSFTTSPDLPIVHSLTATDITPNTTLLNGEVNTKGIPTTVTFQYGELVYYGSEIAASSSPVTDTTMTPVSAPITGLTPNTTYHYRLVTTSAAGTAYSRDMTFSTPIIDDITPTMPVPQQFALLQNFPNPANPVTNITYELPVNSHVKITVFNLKGELVRTLYNGEQNAGRYPLLWDGADDRGKPVSTGLYFLRMEADGFTEMKKMMLIK